MTRVYADVVADLFHYGHVDFLRKARSLGDYLLAGICSDDAVATYKRRPILTLEERVTSVAGFRYVDEVLPDAPLRVTRDWIERHAIDLVVHGDDFYSVPIDMGIFRTVPYTRGISTSEIIRRCRGGSGVALPARHACGRKLDGNVADTPSRDETGERGRCDVRGATKATRTRRGGSWILARERMQLPSSAPTR